MTLDKTEVSSTPHLSVLQFRGRSTQQTTHNQMNNMSIPVDDEGRRGTEKGEPETKTDAVWFFYLCKHFKPSRKLFLFYLYNFRNTMPLPGPCCKDPDELI